MTVAGIPTDAVRTSDLTWANILSKPSTFTPSPHVHPISDISGLGTGVAAALAIAVGSVGGPVVRNGDIGAATGTSLAASGTVSAANVFSTSAGAILNVGNSGGSIVTQYASNNITHYGHSFFANNVTVNSGGVINASSLSTHTFGTGAAVTTITGRFLNVSSGGSFGWVTGTNLHSDTNGGLNIRNGANAVLVSTDGSGNLAFAGATATGVIRSTIADGTNGFTVGAAGGAGLGGGAGYATLNFSATNPGLMVQSNRVAMGSAVLLTWGNGNWASATTTNISQQAAGLLQIGTAVANANGSVALERVLCTAGTIPPMSGYGIQGWSGVGVTLFDAGGQFAFAGPLGTNSARFVVPTTNTWEQRNGTAQQTHSIYGTFTDASNYRRLRFAMTTAGVASITAEGLGTGASGNTITLGSPVTVSGTVTSSFQPLSANPTTIDIAAGLSRLVKNTTSGEVRNWVNDGGVMKSSAAFT